jgi:RHS repeat-associated protein
MQSVAQTSDLDYYTRAENDDCFHGGPGTRTKYTYDANGNMSSRSGSILGWTSYNYPSSVATSTESASFDYGPDRQRWRMIYSGPTGLETTYYATSMFERVNTSAGTDYRHYLYADGRPVVVISRTTAGAITVRSLLVDHQGSISAMVTDQTGALYEKESFTAFGNRRDASTWTGAPTSSDRTLTDAVTREGYTFQTVLGSMGLNHMNGRVQDAITGRFLSADPTIPDPTNSQSYNRYTYVNNNPLTNLDPTGFHMCKPLEVGDQVPDEIRESNDYQCTDDGSDQVHLPDGTPYDPNATYWFPPDTDMSKVVYPSLPAITVDSGSSGFLGDFGEGPIVRFVIPIRGFCVRMGCVEIPQTPHHYSISTPTICSKSDALTMAMAPNMSGPGAPQAHDGIENGIPLVSVFTPNMINQFVSTTNGTIVNTALPGHIFQGTVQTQITASRSGSTIDTVGDGVQGEAPWRNALNTVAGWSLFAARNWAIQSECDAIAGPGVYHP